MRDRLAGCIDVWVLIYKIIDNIFDILRVAFLGSMALPRALSR